MWLEDVVWWTIVGCIDGVVNVLQVPKGGLEIVFWGNLLAEKCDGVGGRRSHLRHLQELSLGGR